MSPILVLVISFLLGAVPFSNIAAHLTRGVDLRAVGNGTVSGTSLYRVAGTGPLVVAGLADVAKGMVGPLLAGSGRPVLGALAACLAITGHDWSPFLRGAGGRGVSPAMGALLVMAWPGALMLLAGVALGRLFDEGGLGGFVAEVSLVPVLAVLMGGTAALAGLAVAVPMLVKRLAGNSRPEERSWRLYRDRLLFDCDDRSSA